MLNLKQSNAVINYCILKHLFEGWPTLCEFVRRLRDTTTGSEFPSLYHSVRQIPQLIVILQTCNL